MVAKSSNIVCLGWGSLTYAPGSLHVSGEWETDGPQLPIEFARQSLGNKITLVLCPDVRPVTALWARLNVRDMSSAEENLGSREYPGANDAWIEQNIGSWSRSVRASRGREVDVIGRWAMDKGFDGVVWTNLPCKFNGVSNVMPTAAQVIHHLERLTGDEKEAAETYVRKTPKQIDTDYRRVIEKELGWIYR